MGEQAAEKHNGPRYDETRLKHALREMRALTVLPPEKFGARLQSLFSEAGVVFVLVPAITGSHVSSVAR